MKTLVLKDLARIDELDRAASLSVRGGIAHLTREAPSACPGGLEPVLVRRGWIPCPPVHPGCGPVYFPFGNMPSHPEPTVVPL
ncbi:hypothetical protein [Paraburkholderia aromaticivorans]|uniref:Uncharacterized protein n=1 Tax=Paraburkholderia aromaticivorans TaxID=2026199 RepID=A0A248VP39_9BURK|nr:hypothetical protein [Paraburkholderia aromaticivorans]ASW00797.1 hypothetical protein CJU94_21385 [Paraburkholderia aromaticivorans]